MRTSEANSGRRLTWKLAAKRVRKRHDRAKTGRSHLESVRSNFPVREKPGPPPIPPRSADVVAAPSVAPIRDGAASETS